ncbi:AraC family transcriptional regulator [Azospirillum sp. YIM DDC1]|uniref:AraC family transcriptional regulator n=1 Tax=Azospirillum aestuarii TaxID=2802052 RepID=A0ABS1I881_9PROT|nr:helix-turn-helix domain-containing protein [Azospirillum brasilense]MBK4723264.1 AraC family transcriptional regulator [Azospirillum aestuarii]
MIVQNAPADVLSDVLRLMQAQTLCSARLAARGDWSIRFQPPSAIKFNVVTAGTCWIRPDGPDGPEAPRRLDAGDCFVVVRGGFVLSSAPDLSPVPAAEVFQAPGGEARVNVGDGARGGDGDEVRFLGGSVRFDRLDGGLLFDLLPRLLMIRGGAPGAAPVGWLLEQLDREWRGGTVGSQLACNDLLRLMFVHALRTHLSEQPPQGANWLAACLDPSIGRALGAIHGEPCRNWTLAELAGIAGRSRSSFAAAFRERVGVPPIDYMLRWRMRLAATRLRQGQEPVSAIAASLGYLSDSAFSATFRRIMGVSPARYRTGADRTAASDLGSPIRS